MNHLQLMVNFFYFNSGCLTFIKNFNNYRLKIDITNLYWEKIKN